MRSPGRFAVTAGLAVLAVAGGIHFGLERPGRAVDAASVSALTRTVFHDLAGRAARIEEWRGKVVVVNFWASWCPPCRDEIPGLVRLQNAYAANGLQIVGIAVDSVEKTRQASTEMGIAYPVLVGGVEAVDLARRLGNRGGGLPYTVVLDRHGSLIATHLGPITEVELERLIAPLLG